MATTSGTGTLTSAGVGSGLDVTSIVNSLMQVESQPLTDIATQKTAYQTKLSAYGQIQSALASLQTAMANLATPTKFNAQSLTSGDTSVFTAVSNGSASLSSYNISVSQLAQSQKLSATGFANTTDAVGTGTLTFSFPNNSAKSDVSITIDSSNNSLTGIRDAINSSGASVSASIVNDGTTNRLVFTSKDSGEINTMKISVTDGDGNNTDTSGLSKFAYDPSGTQNLTVLQAAKNALLKVDGIDVVKPSNTITDALDGVTLNLLKTSPSTTTTDNQGATVTTFSTVALNVATDNTKVKANLQAFVDAYNKLNTTMKTLTKFDSAGTTTGTVSKSNGPLIGDATARSISSQISSILNQTVATGGTYTSMSQIGISFQSDGTLALDSTKLNTAINTDFSSVSALFAGTTSGGTTTLGYGAQLNTTLTSMLASDGILQSKTDGFNSSIKQLDKKTDDWNVRLVAIKARYTAQYNALDVQISNMNSTTSLLTQEIAQFNANK